MAPHVLHMTATPIPRTLSLTAYGDLDTTALHELPAGPAAGRDAAGRGGRSAAKPSSSCARGCARAARPSSSARWSPSRRKCRARRPRSRRSGCGPASCATSASALLHGQMRSGEKAEAMRAFAAGETDVLVATTVIEVGIDVANATVMVIEGAERFGVSQLHQLRGRVGRGEHPSQCLLFAEEAGELARRRLQAVARGERRLQARRGRPGAARRGRDPRHPPERPAALRRRRAARGRRRCCSRRARRCWRCCDAHGSLEDPALGPLLDAARRRFGAGAADPIPL